MSKQLDVYRNWLGITETARPLNYYQLLRLKTFNDDTAKIREHYRKMNAHVRKFASGDYVKQSKELLNELAKAMLCLTDAQRKRKYDASLGREDEGEDRRHTLEEILLAGKVIDQVQLSKARSYAEAVGLEVRDALVQQKMAEADVVMIAYAESQGLPYIELADVGVSEQLVPRVPANIARQHSCVPVMIDDGQLLIASPNPLAPDVEEKLRLRFDMPVRTILCTASSIHTAVAEHYPHDADDEPSDSKKASSKQEKRGPKSQKERVYLTKEEKIRRHSMFAVIAFNTAVIVVVVFFLLLRGGWAFFGLWDFLSVLVLALIAAGATFGIAMKLEK